MKDILEIFYKSIIPEASQGTINCYFCFNMPFSTIISEFNSTTFCSFTDSELLIPTLEIKNKKEFDSLLKEYVNLALEFYDNDNFPPEILDDKMFDTTFFICKEKMIMSLLWSNATIEDFKNPNLYLKKRIDFLKNYNYNSINLGYSNILKGNLEITIKKDSIMNEAPSLFLLKLLNKDSQEFIFPHIKFGISNNTIYIYSMQNPKIKNSNEYSKSVNRVLYKIGEGFDATQDNYERFLEGNLKDITPSFLVALNIFLSYFSHIGYSNFIVSNFLIERWNAKTMAIKKKAQVYQYKEKEVELEKQEIIWHNLIEKLIRTVYRLKHHQKSIQIIEEPFTVDSNLHFLFDNNSNYNNTLLEETSNLASSKETDKKL